MNELNKIYESNKVPLNSHIVRMGTITEIGLKICDIIDENKLSYIERIILLKVLKIPLDNPLDKKRV